MRLIIYINMVGLKKSIRKDNKVKNVLFLWISALLILVFTASAVAGEPIHKRVINGVEEYECLLINETKHYVIVVIDGKRVSTLNPVDNHPNTYDRSAQKIWISLQKHVLKAFGYSSQAKITRGNPEFETNEHNLDISNRVDKEPAANGAYNTPAIVIEDALFKPYKSASRHHHP